VRSDTERSPGLDVGQRRIADVAVPAVSNWLAISTVCHVTDKPLNNAGGGTWRLSATLVGLVAMVVAGWAVNAIDIDNSGSFYFVAWLALAVGFIGIATVVLVPRAKSRERRGLTRGAHRS
jgi:hypothetical protein